MTTCVEKLKNLEMSGMLTRSGKCHGSVSGEFLSRTGGQKPFNLLLVAHSEVRTGLHDLPFSSLLYCCVWHWFVYYYEVIVTLIV